MNANGKGVWSTLAIWCSLKIDLPEVHLQRQCQEAAALKFGSGILGWLPPFPLAVVELC